VAGEESALRTAGQPGGRALRPADESEGRRRGSRIPDRRDDAPVDGTIPERADVAFRQLAERTATRNVRRTQPGTRRRARDRARRLDGRRHAARRDRSARDGDAAHPAADGQRAGAASGRAAVSLGIRGRDRGRHRQRSALNCARPERQHSRSEGVHLRRLTRSTGKLPRRATARRRAVAYTRACAGNAEVSATGGTGHMIAELVNAFARPEPPAPRQEPGFFTDTTLCIGWKACEVACKQWNQLPADGFHWTGNSYDNTVTLSDTTWRHVAFVEQFDGETESRPDRWLMMSDVCKHCAQAPCQEVCPTGAIIYN